MAAGASAFEDLAKGALASLNGVGFVALPQVFTAGDIAEVEAMLDDLVARAIAGRLPPAAAKFARDMAPEGSGAGPGLDWRQPEVDYVASLCPDLLQSAVFRTCSRLATAVGGRVSRSFDHVIYKPPDHRVATGWHQDGAFSHWKPSGRTSHLHFWIPLQAATADNGCMQFIPGSHRLPLLRHDRFVRRSGGRGLELATLAPSAGVACPIDIGGLTIHTPRTLHRAGENRTERTRKAWIVQFTPWGSLQLGLKRRFGLSPAPLRE